MGRGHHCTEGRSFHRALCSGRILPGSFALNMPIGSQEWTLPYGHLQKTHVGSGGSCEIISLNAILGGFKPLFFIIQLGKKRVFCIARLITQALRCFNLKLTITSGIQGVLSYFKALC